MPRDRLRQRLRKANLEPLDVLPLAQATLLMPILEEFEQPDEVEEQTMTDAEEKAFAEFEALNAEDEKLAVDLNVEANQTPNLES